LGDDAFMQQLEGQTTRRLLKGKAGRPFSKPKEQG